MRQRVPQTWLTENMIVVLKHRRENIVGTTTSFAFWPRDRPEKIGEYLIDIQNPMGGDAKMPMLQWLKPGTRFRLAERREKALTVSSRPD